MAWPAPWQDEGLLTPFIVSRGPAVVQLRVGRMPHRPASAFTPKRGRSWQIVRKLRKVQDVVKPKVVHAVAIGLDVAVDPFTEEEGSSLIWGEDQGFEANTKAIPPKDTPVKLIFRNH